jgi:hypothetical protein
MIHMNALSKKLLSLSAATLCLIILSSCNSKVVIGRARPSEPVVQEKVATKPAQKKPVEVKETQKVPAPAEAVNKPKPIADSGGGMMGSTSKTEPVQENAAPQSSPARPAPVSKSDEKSSSLTSPYKLDLSFGGFGLGVGLFDTPVSVAVDDQENMYVVDQGNFRIQKFDRFGIFQFAWGRQGMGDGEFVEQAGPVLRMTGEFDFNKPIGMLVDKDDTRNLVRIHVVDSLNNRIQRFLLVQHQGELFPSFGSQNVFWKLTKSGTEADTSGGSDSNNLEDKYKKEGRQAILDPIYLNANPGCNKANASLLAPFIWGGLGYTQGLLNNPTYIAKDENNILYVSDTENGRVQGFYLTPNECRTDATFYREWGNDLNLQYGAGRLKEPTAIAYDNTGFGGFLVLDKLQGGSYNIQRFDRDGQFVGVFAASGDKEGQFRQPVGIAINTFDNTLFVTDKSRRKVMVYNNKGEYMYEFGGEELADPRGVAVLRNNYVYVTDAAKNMVYRYVPQ